ncbi:MAG TPA: HlyD family efflux transporter periplasmic adaptor subunit [Xanthomonadaceae bacterium]|nr:HlyD family efflux transporter periplasmic adaptor subunit [Xanthomonadaceae bacterium]
MKPRTLLIAAAVAVLAVLVAWGFAGPAREMELAQVVRGPFELGFEEEGRTRLRERYLVAAPVAGTLRRIELEPGDAVAAGHTLAQLVPLATALLDPGRRAQIEADLASAREIGRAAGQLLAAARAAERTAQRDLQRAQSLHASGAVSESALESARVTLEQAGAAVAVARADVLAAAERERVAQALLSSAGESGLQPIDLQAPVAGVVIRRHRESAVPVQAGEPLLEIGDPGDLEIEVEALSTDAVKLRPGMPARVVRWGGEQTLQAEVVRIEPGGFTKVSALGVEEQRTRVILRLSSPHEHWSTLGDGYRVEVEFVQQRQEDALTVPASAVFRHQRGWAVYRVQGGRARVAPIEQAAMSAEQVEIRRGLAPGDLVIRFPDDEIVEGARVAPAGAD